MIGKDRTTKLAYERENQEDIYLVILASNTLVSIVRHSRAVQRPVLATDNVTVKLVTSRLKLQTLR